jgi:hypothetical protein
MNIEATQDDHEAAADFADWHEGFRTAHEVDQLAKAFATHRIAAEERQKERDAKIAEERAQAYAGIARPILLNAARQGEAERIATAIREGKS